MATITPSPTASAAFRRRGTRLNRLCERVLLNRAKFRLIKLILVVKGRGRRRRRRRFAGTERGSRLSQRFLNPCRGRVRATEHASRDQEAVAEAVEASAEDTKGQTCYICTQALHWKTKEGLVRGCACRGTAGFAHVSCLAEQAKILFAEADENNLSIKTWNERWERWYNCSLCEQYYHGVVACALGWACWKTYVGRPEADEVHGMAMSVLGNGLSASEQHEDALSVKEAELATLRRIGAAEESILGAQNNLANTYQHLGRLEQALRMRQDTYSRQLKLNGAQDPYTITAAICYASNLNALQHHAQAKTLTRKTMPVARRVLGESHELTLRVSCNFAEALYEDPDATLDDIREAVTMLEDTVPTARRVFGSANPIAEGIEESLRDARAALRAREVLNASV